MPSLYMINPAPSTFRPDFEGEGWVSSPDLAIVTLAAMAPAHWRVVVTEELISPVDLDSEADFVGLTGKSCQLEGIQRLAEHFRRRGAIVIVGGPLASLNPDAVRPFADILVTGEMEDIYPAFFSDLEQGSWRAIYEGGQADISRAPPPRWDLYPVDRAMSGALQTTRGCPFACEFCDVIVYQGRKQRHKPIANIIEELDQLYAAGFREVFLTDDNFTVHKRFAREVLDALTGWNARQPARTRFYTQASLDLARDAELIESCRRAGLTRLFVGIETANEDSLRETGKRQNLLMPIREAAERLVAGGLSLRSGLIVGFDHDGPTIFEDLFAFFQTAPLPELVVSVLSPTIGTPLHARLLREGRLLGGGAWTEMRPDACGFQPKQMSPQALAQGARDLAQALYAAEAFERRMLRLIELTPGEGAGDDVKASRSPPAPRSRHVAALLGRIPRRGPAERRMMSNVLDAASDNAAALRAAMIGLVYFEQQRGVMDRQSSLAAPTAPERPAVFMAPQPA